MMLSNGSTGKATKIRKDDTEKVKAVMINLALADMEAEGITVDKLRRSSMTEYEKHIFYESLKARDITIPEFLTYIFSIRGDSGNTEMKRPKESTTTNTPMSKKKKKCKACKGVGYRTIESKDPGGYVRQSYGKCPDCRGTGER